MSPTASFHREESSDEIDCLRPEFPIHLNILGDIGKGTENTRAYELPTLDAVFLNYIVSIPDRGSEVILMAMRDEEVLSEVDLRLLIISETDLSSLSGIILLLLRGKVLSLHLVNEFIGLLSLFSHEEGGIDNGVKGVTLPMADTVIGSFFIGNDKTVRANESEDTSHDTERGRTIMRVHDNDFGASFVRGKGIKEVTMRETYTMLRDLARGTSLRESISNLITLSTEGINDLSGGILTILFSTSIGVIGLEYLGATSSDFGISECEHNI